VGTFAADLATLSHFFERRWDRPAARLSPSSQALVLKLVGCRLMVLGRDEEALEPLTAALTRHRRLGEWARAADDTNHLSQLHLARGELSRALDRARQSVEIAQASPDVAQRIDTLTTLGDVLHQAGQYVEAEGAFRRAEEQLASQGSARRWLPSLEGYQYCDLLLTLGRYQEVIERTETALQAALANGWLFDAAVEQLSLGQAHLLKAQSENARPAAAERYLGSALEGLRQAGHQEFIVMALLAIAGLRHLKKDLTAMEEALGEAKRRATRHGLRLYEADCHLAAR
jgi:tetratricopeptide (TPR) repeat protein